MEFFNFNNNFLIKNNNTNNIYNNKYLLYPKLIYLPIFLGKEYLNLNVKRKGFLITLGYNCFFKIFSICFNVELKSFDNVISIPLIFNKEYWFNKNKVFNIFQQFSFNSNFFKKKNYISIYNSNRYLKFSSRKFLINVYALNLLKIFNNEIEVDYKINNNLFINKKLLLFKNNNYKNILEYLKKSFFFDYYNIIQFNILKTLNILFFYNFYFIHFSVLGLFNNNFFINFEIKKINSNNFINNEFILFNASQLKFLEFWNQFYIDKFINNFLKNYIYKGFFLSLYFNFLKNHKFKNFILFYGSTNINFITNKNFFFINKSYDNFFLLNLLLFLVKWFFKKKKIIFENNNNKNDINFLVNFCNDKSNNAELFSVLHILKMYIHNYVIIYLQNLFNTFNIEECAHSFIFLSDNFCNIFINGLLIFFFRRFNMFNIFKFFLFKELKDDIFYNNQNNLVKKNENIIYKNNWDNNIYEKLKKNILIYVNNMIKCSIDLNFNNFFKKQKFYYSYFFLLKSYNLNQLNDSYFNNFSCSSFSNYFSLYRNFFDFNVKDNSLYFKNLFNNNFNIFKHNDKLVNNKIFQLNRKKLFVVGDDNSGNNKFNKKIISKTINNNYFIPNKIYNKLMFRLLKKNKKKKIFFFKINNRFKLFLRKKKIFKDNFISINNKFNTNNYKIKKKIDKNNNIYSNNNVNFFENLRLFDNTTIFKNNILILKIKRFKNLIRNLFCKNSFNFFKKFFFFKKKIYKFIKFKNYFFNKYLDLTKNEYFIKLKKYNINLYKNNNFNDNIFFKKNIEKNLIFSIFNNRNNDFLNYNNDKMFFFNSYKDFYFYNIKNFVNNNSLFFLKQIWNNFLINDYILYCYKIIFGINYLFLEEFNLYNFLLKKKLKIDNFLLKKKLYKFQFMDKLILFRLFLINYNFFFNKNISNKQIIDNLDNKGYFFYKNYFSVNQDVIYDDNFFIKKKKLLIEYFNFLKEKNNFYKLLFINNKTNMKFIKFFFYKINENNFVKGIKNNNIKETKISYYKLYNFFKKKFYNIKKNINNNKIINKKLEKLNNKNNLKFVKMFKKKTNIYVEDNNNSSLHFNGFFKKNVFVTWFINFFNLFVIYKKNNKFWINVKFFFKFLRSLKKFFVFYYLILFLLKQILFKNNINTAFKTYNNNIFYKIYYKRYYYFFKKVLFYMNKTFSSFYYFIKFFFKFRIKNFIKYNYYNTKFFREKNLNYLNFFVINTYNNFVNLNFFSKNIYLDQNNDKFNFNTLSLICKNKINFIKRKLLFFLNFSKSKFFAINNNILSFKNSFYINYLKFLILIVKFCNKGNNNRVILKNKNLENKIFYFNFSNNWIKFFLKLNNIKKKNLFNIIYLNKFKLFYKNFFEKENNISINYNENLFFLNYYNLININNNNFLNIFRIFKLNKKIINYLKINKKKRNSGKISFFERYFFEKYFLTFNSLNNNIYKIIDNRYNKITTIMFYVLKNLKILYFFFFYKNNYNKNLYFYKINNLVKNNSFISLILFPYTINLLLLYKFFFLKNYIFYLIYFKKLFTFYKLTFFLSWFLEYINKFYLYYFNNIFFKIAFSLIKISNNKLSSLLVNTNSFYKIDFFLKYSYFFYNINNFNYRNLNNKKILLLNKIFFVNLNFINKIEDIRLLFLKNKHVTLLSYVKYVLNNYIYINKVKYLNNYKKKVCSYYYKFNNNNRFINYCFFDKIFFNENYSPAIRIFTKFKDLYNIIYIFLKFFIVNNRIILKKKNSFMNYYKKFMILKDFEENSFPSINVTRSGLFYLKKYANSFLNKDLYFNIFFLGKNRLKNYFIYTNNLKKEYLNKILFFFVLFKLLFYTNLSKNDNNISCYSKLLLPNNWYDYILYKYFKNFFVKIFKKTKYNFLLKFIKKYRKSLYFYIKNNYKLLTIDNYKSLSIYNYKFLIVLFYLNNIRNNNKVYYNNANIFSKIFIKKNLKKNNYFFNKLNKYLFTWRKDEKIFFNKNVFYENIIKSFKFYNYSFRRLFFVLGNCFINNPLLKSLSVSELNDSICLPKDEFFVFKKDIDQNFFKNFYLNKFWFDFFSYPIKFKKPLVLKKYNNWKNKLKYIDDLPIYQRNFLKQRLLNDFIFKNTFGNNNDDFINNNKNNIILDGKKNFIKYKKNIKKELLIKFFKKNKKVFYKFLLHSRFYNAKKKFYLILRKRFIILYKNFKNIFFNIMLLLTKNSFLNFYKNLILFKNIKYKKLLFNNKSFLKKKLFKFEEKKILKIDDKLIKLLFKFRWIFFFRLFCIYRIIVNNVPKFLYIFDYSNILKNYDQNNFFVNLNKYKNKKKKIFNILEKKILNNIKNSKKSLWKV